VALSGSAVELGTRDRIPRYISPYRGSLFDFGFWIGDCGLIPHSTFHTPQLNEGGTSTTLTDSTPPRRIPSL